MKPMNKIHICRFSKKWFSKLASTGRRKHNENKITATINRK